MIDSHGDIYSVMETSAGIGAKDSLHGYRATKPLTKTGQRNKAWTGLRSKVGRVGPSLSLHVFGCGDLQCGSVASRDSCFDYGAYHDSLPGHGLDAALPSFFSVGSGFFCPPYLKSFG